MRYVVMECHLSYAVVLNEDGRFLNVANRHYEVGQTVTDVVEIQQTPQITQDSSVTRKISFKMISSLVAMAACLVLIITAVFQITTASPYASVYMTINPEVRIDVNKNDIVVDIEGINDDGIKLIEDYSYKKKNLDLVMDELVDRAIDMGYLHEGDQITLTLNADDGEWVVTKSDTIGTHLNDHLTDKLSVTIEITNNSVNDKSDSGQSVIIPIGPNNSTSGEDYAESDYGNTVVTTVTTTPKNESNTAITTTKPNDENITQTTTTTTLKPNAETQTSTVTTVNTVSDDDDNGYGDSGYDDGDSDYDSQENEGQSDYEEDDDD